ncbi:MAG: SRPBCC domain-containing protein [bacterium]
MKILKGVLGILAAFVIGFFLVGFFVPTFTYLSKVVVDKPVGEAFAIFNDESRLGEWLAGFKSIESVSGEPNQVGSTYKLVIEDEGEVMEMMGTVTAFVENELLSFHLVNDVMTVDTDIRFVSQGDRTEITATQKVEGRNLFWKSLLPLFQSVITQKSQENYDRLKTVIEATTLEPAPDTDS